MRDLKMLFNKKDISKLKAGDRVLFSGVIYTARDQAHKKMVETLEKRRRLPIDLAGQIIYYCGPTPALKGRPIGACGPTTSSRMDEFTPCLLSKGLLGMIGKGDRSREVREAIKRNKAIYFITIGGAGAYLSRRVASSRIVGYKELGPEAIYRLEVDDFPLIVAIDSRGRSIFNGK